MDDDRIGDAIWITEDHLLGERQSFGGVDKPSRDSHSLGRHAELLRVELEFERDIIDLVLHLVLQHQRLVPVVDDFEVSFGLQPEWHDGQNTKSSIEEQLGCVTNPFELELLVRLRGIAVNINRQLDIILLFLDWIEGELENLLII